MGRVIIRFCFVIYVVIRVERYIFYFFVKNGLRKSF